MNKQKEMNLKLKNNEGFTITDASGGTTDVLSINNKSNSIPITSASTEPISVNEYRDFGQVSELTVTLSGVSSSVYDTWKFSFVCETNATAITFPQTVKHPVGHNINDYIAAGRRFECIIDYANCLTFNCWD